MSIRGAVLVLLSALLTVAANLLLRTGVRKAQFTLEASSLAAQGLRLLQEPIFVIGVIFYGLAAVVWFGVMGIEDLSTSYPVMVSLVFILVSLGAIFLFGEKFTTQKLLGMLLILGGVVLVARA